MMGVPIQRAGRGARIACAMASSIRAPARRCSANDPMVFCRSQSTAGLALLTRRFGIRGYATSVHTACASGGQAIGTAMKLIRRGVADSRSHRRLRFDDQPGRPAGFCLLSAVSPDNDTPTRASRPFDATRNGFVLGEGAGFLVLEEWGSGAAARGAHLRRARGRRQLALELSHHRLASIRATGRSRRCARRWPTPASGRGRRLHQCARHLDADERPQRGAAMGAVFGDGRGAIASVRPRARWDT